MFLNLPIGIFIGSSIAWPDGDYLTLIWCAVPIIANLCYGSYVIATQFDDKSGESCQKMRDFAKLESISAIVFGLLYACLFCFVAIVVHSLKKNYSYHDRRMHKKITIARGVKKTRNAGMGERASDPLVV